MSLGTEQCNQCYGMPPRCMHGRTPGTVCSQFTPDAAANRMANGTMTAGFTATLDGNVRTVQGPAMDVLAGHTAAGETPFTAGSADEILAAAPGTVALATLGAAVSVARARPNLVNTLYDAVAALLGAGGTAAEVARITSTLSQLQFAQQAAITANAAELPATATSFNEKRYPLSTFFQTVVKNVVSGISLQADPDEMYDTVARQRVVAFKRAAKVTSGSMLMYSVHVFCEAITQIKNLAPVAWREFIRRVMLCEVSEGFIFAQEFVDCCLRRLDEQTYPSIVDLMRAGEHNRILDELRHTVKPTFVPKDDKPKPGTTDPRERIKFGPVTVPVGGEGAGIINDFATKKPKMCNRFHGNPRTACTAGVPQEAKFPTSSWGKCAYKH